MTGAVSRHPRPTRIVVCIATRDRPEGLRRLLEALCSQQSPPLPFSLVVVDNSDIPRAHAIVEPFTTRLAVQCVHQPTVGIPFARNAALDLLGRDDVAAFIDDDTEPPGNWLDALYRSLEQFDCDAVDGPVQYLVGETAPRWIVDAAFQRTAREHGRGVEHGSRIRYAATCNSMVRIASLQDRGLRFDERFPLLGGEDSWMYHSLATTGGDIRWTDDAVVREFVPANRVTVRWVLRRAFRNGYDPSVRRLHRGTARTWVVECCRVLARFADALRLAVSSLIGGRRFLLRSAARFAKASGTVWAMVGGHFEDYRVTDGA